MSNIMPVEVFVMIFRLLQRKDLEALQLVCANFYSIATARVLNGDGPLRELRDLVIYGKSVDAPYRYRVVPNDAPSFESDDFDQLGLRLRLCAVRNLEFESCGLDADLVDSLMPLKDAWKNADLATPPESYASGDVLERFLDELVLCKAIEIDIEERFDLKKPLLHYEAIKQCHELRLLNHQLPYRIAPKGINEWLKHEPKKEWRCEPKRLEMCEDHLSDGVNVLIVMLKKVASENDYPYTLRIRMEDTADVMVHVRSNAANEPLTHSAEHCNGYNFLKVERK
ncbi:hypothetical protein AAVH_10376 [Aphelenchoides avenae]|nr:hypothetical protein AAVH_10376 [Aphelenchus avenae]